MVIKRLFLLTMVCILFSSLFIGCTDKNQDQEWNNTAYSDLINLIFPTAKMLDGAESTAQLSDFGIRLERNSTIALNNSRTYIVSDKIINDKKEYEAYLMDMRNLSLEAKKLRDANLLEMERIEGNIDYYGKSAVDHLNNTNFVIDFKKNNTNTQSKDIYWVKIIESDINIINNDIDIMNRNINKKDLASLKTNAINLKSHAQTALNNSQNIQISSNLEGANYNYINALNNAIQAADLIIYSLDTNSPDKLEEAKDLYRKTQVDFSITNEELHRKGIK